MCKGFDASTAFPQPSTVKYQNANIADMCNERCICTMAVSSFKLKVQTKE